MYIKWNITGVIAFLILGALVYQFGPGFGGLGRTAISLVLYAAIFFACFVVVRRR
ncbi:MAG: hypothetical protein MJ053_00330 [Elusimicrobiaceae bacterium]|nr:hypothetical protein [Elusimicrobiaceae bacterium]